MVRITSACVAITNKFPEGRNVVRWIKNGWHIIVAYIIGFFALYLILGWEPADNKGHKVEPAGEISQVIAERE